MNNIEQAGMNVGRPPKTIKPPRLIPEFNALGNHPENMVDFIDTHVRGAFERLGFSDKYPQARETLLNALEELAERPDLFTGHYIPNSKTKPVSELMIDTFVDLEKCNFFGKENFDQAIKLTEEGNNILIAQNHTSPVDTIVPMSIIKRTYGDIPISIVMSQVFEYARITNLITCGLDKFPVFQPKHISRFKDKKEVTEEMSRQNMITLRSLVSYAREGGKMIFLYPEKDRNNDDMGVSEPGAMAVPELLSKAGRELYVLPTFVSGVNSIFPNQAGRNEMDDFFEIIKKGQGDFYCGKPFKYSEMIQLLELIPQEKQIEIAKITTGKDINDTKTIRKAVISAIVLGKVAQLSPNKKVNGIYGDENVQELINQIK